MRYIFVSLYLLSCVCIPVWGNDVLEMMRNQNVDNVVDIPQEYIYENPMITYPDDDIQVDVWGRIDPASVTSFSITHTAVAWCSRIARENLSLLTNLPSIAGFSPDNTAISKHDALWLITNGDLEHALVDDVLQILGSRYDLQQVTILDVYMYNTQGDPEEDRINDGHRAIVFLGTDNERYVLDPLRGTKTIAPQLLKEYMVRYEFRTREWYVPYYGYRPDTSGFTPINFVVPSTIEKPGARIVGDVVAGYLFPDASTPIKEHLAPGPSMLITDTHGDRYQVRIENDRHVRLQAAKVDDTVISLERTPSEYVEASMEIYISFLRYVHSLI